MNGGEPRHAAGALAGIRIVDVSEGIAGPYATSLLGDLGAEVIKVERPDGDWGRTAGREFGDGLGALYVAMNRNKRCLALDLKQPAATEVVRRLIASAHVLVSNYRHGAMERLGLGHAACRALRPGLVYCTITGFDTQGPYAQRPGSDSGLQAVSGFMSLNGEAGGEPVRAGIPVVDMTAALFVSQGVLAALRLPRDSPGRRVEVSLLNAAAALQTLAFTEFLNSGVVPPRYGNQNPFIAPAGAFAGRDGRYFTIACLKESHWHNLCAVIGRPELAAEPRYASNALRLQHRHALSPMLAEIFAVRPAADWVRLLQDGDVLCAFVNDLSEVVADPGLGPTLPIAAVAASAPAPLRTLGNPVRYGGAFPQVALGPADIGADTEAVLAEAGYSPAEIAQLISSQAASSASDAKS